MGSDTSKPVVTVPPPMDPMDAMLEIEIAS
jgi:hypothetical protein